MMRFPMLQPAMALVLFCCPAADAAAAAAARPAHARGNAAVVTQTRGEAPPRPAARASRSKPRIVHLPSSSQESPEQRDRRLARECRGLPNAGACLGHALAGPRAAPRRR